MPQLILEYSSNILEKDIMQRVFKDCHAILVETLPTQLSSCKSRAIECTQYYVGDGQAKNAFIHLTVKVLPGRNATVLNMVGENMMEKLLEYFSESVKKLNLQMTIEITELSPYYFKVAG